MKWKEIDVMTDSSLAKEICSLDPTAVTTTNSGGLKSRTKLIALLTPLREKRDEEESKRKNELLSILDEQVRSPSSAPSIGHVSSGVTSTATTVPSTGASTPTGASSTVTPSMMEMVQALKDTLQESIKSTIHLSVKEANEDVRNQVSTLVSRLDELEKRKGRSLPTSKPSGPVMKGNYNYVSNLGSQFHPSPMKMGGGGAYDDDIALKATGAVDPEDDDYSVDSEVDRQNRKLVAAGKLFRDLFLAQLEESIGKGDLISLDDLEKLYHRDGGLAFLDATGAVILRSLAGRGSAKTPLVVTFTEASSFPDTAKIPGPTFKTITALLLRSVHEWRRFWKEQTDLVTSRHARIGMSSDDALKAVQCIAKFGARFEEVYTKLLGPEGPTQGGGKHQWTNWLALFLFFYTIWHRALMEGDFSLLQSLFNDLLKEARYLMTDPKDDTTPTLPLDKAMFFAEQHCSRPACQSNSVACDEVCYACKDQRLVKLEEALGVRKSEGEPSVRILSKSEWEAQHREDTSKWSKDEKEKKYAVYKERKANEKSKRGPNPKPIANLRDYTDRMSRHQDVIGSPPTLVGHVPRPIDPIDPASKKSY